MTDAPPARPRPLTVLRSIVTSPLTLWAAFVLVHLVLGLLALYAPGLPLGDVTLVYLFWVEQGLSGNLWVGIDTAWVYPILGLVPMLAAYVLGPDQYGATWLSLVMLLNAVAFGFVTGWGRRRDRTATGWWWVAFLALLGPIAVARIDSITVPIAMIGVLLLASRPLLATALLAVATWIKVWPAALVLAALIAIRDRLRVVAGAALVSAIVLVAALLIGASGSVLSFITQQTGRGLQIEAPVSTIWMWMARASVPGAFVYYDRGILTYQVEGPGWELAAAAMTPVLVVAVAVIAVLGVVAVRRGAAVGDLLPPLALALVTALIAFNKVGSPQFVTWLAVPVVLGVATSAAGWGRSFRVPAALALVIAGLTPRRLPLPLRLAALPRRAAALGAHPRATCSTSPSSRGRSTRSRRRRAGRTTHIVGETEEHTTWPFRGAEPIKE
jgi:hypothetical protein